MVPGVVTKNDGSVWRTLENLKAEDWRIKELNDDTFARVLKQVFWACYPTELD